MTQEKSSQKPKNKSKNSADKIVSAARTNDFLLPSVLSFRRSFEITDGIMSAEKKKNGEIVATDVLLYDHGQRTAKSHETTKGKGDTLRSGEDSANLVNGQQAKIPPGFDTLVVKTSIRVLPIRPDPDSCGSDLWYLALRDRINGCRHSGTISLLSRLYAYNIANGSWLWRNRTVTDKVEIAISFGEKNLVVSEALDMYSTPVLSINTNEEDPHLSCKFIDPLAEAIEAAFNGDTKSLRIDIVAKVAMAPGQSIWPSQRYTPAKRVVGRTDKGDDLFSGRDFFTVGDLPAITAEKIGNALRTFDRDHGHDVFSDAVIPVEPNGGSLKHGINLRRSGNDLRSLLPIFIGVKKDATGIDPVSMSEKDEMYVMGCIIRGGVFGGSNKEAQIVAPKAETETQE